MSQARYTRSEGGFRGFTVPFQIGSKDFKRVSEALQEALEEVSEDFQRV